MTKTVATLALTLFALTAAAAPPTAESIESLLKITKTETIVNHALDNIEQGMRQGLAQGLAGKQLTDEQRRKAEAEPTRQMAVMREELGWGKIKAIYIQAYQDTFTQDEVNGLLAFYRSPAGKAFVEKMPAIAQKANTGIQGKLGPLLENLRAAVQKSVAEAGAKK
ncbi:MAG: DUF2059 domain-containing protein [Rhodocyclaceae bacterium]|nr:DUF2059 domain-containing protein [Rhodocyclaceae bacterium]